MTALSPCATDFESRRQQGGRGNAGAHDEPRKCDEGQAKATMYNKNRESCGTDVPLSESTIPMALADIRRRCGDLLDENAEPALTLADDEDGQRPANRSFDPYDRAP